MRAKNIGILFILVLFIVSLSSYVFAQPFSVTDTSIQNRIYIDESAQYQLVLKNEWTQADTYQIITSDPSWRISYGEDIFSINASKSKTIMLSLKPVRTVLEGKVYSVPIIINSLDSKDTTELKLQVILDSPTARQYAPSVSAVATIGDEGDVDPSKIVDVKLKIINQNPLEINSLQVRISSPFFSGQFVTKLDSNEEILHIESFRIDPLLAPQKFYVDVTVVANNISLGMIKRQAAQIIASEPGFTREILVDKNEFLYHEYSVKLTNPGNVESTETLQLDSSLWQRLFTKSDFPVTYQKVDGKYLANFKVTIASGASIEFNVVQNYRPFVITTIILVAIILLCTVLYYTFRSAIVVTKKIRITTGDEDGAQKLKVVLNIKNRTGNVLENVKVIERTPNITEVDKQFIVGTLKPTKIVSNAVKGTLVRWDFNSLDPFEERIITYNVTSKLAILGSMNLPQTLVKYDSSGKTRSTRNETSHDQEFV